MGILNKSPDFNYIQNIKEVCEEDKNWTFKSFTRFYTFPIPSISFVGTTMCILYIFQTSQVRQKTQLQQIYEPFLYNMRYL